MIHPYSPCDTTNVFNNVSMISLMRVLKVRKIHPTIRLPLATTPVMCLFNFPLGSKMIPRSLPLSFTSTGFL